MTIAVCLIARNEASYLLEWIAYYRALGFDKIIIYDNESRDLTATILGRLAQAGIVDYHPWPDRSGINRQASAYEDAVARYRARVAWMAFFDIDEFLVLKHHGSIAVFLREYELYSGVAINWRVFGSSGHRVRTRGLVIERFAKCAVRTAPPNRCIKVIVRPEQVTACSIHICQIQSGALVDADGIDIMPTLQGGGIHARISHSAAQLNHYIVKSWEEWLQKKARGRAAVTPETAEQRWTDSRFADHDLNDDEDVDILQRRDAVRVQLDGIGKVLQGSSASPAWRYLQMFH
jgi:hypothetical protein